MYSVCLVYVIVLHGIVSHVLQVIYLWYCVWQRSLVCIPSGDLRAPMGCVCERAIRKLYAYKNAALCITDCEDTSDRHNALQFTHLACPRRGHATCQGTSHVCSHQGCAESAGRNLQQDHTRAGRPRGVLEQTWLAYLCSDLGVLCLPNVKKGAQGTLDVF